MFLASRDEAGFDRGSGGSWKGAMEEVATWVAALFMGFEGAFVRAGIDPPLSTNDVVNTIF